MKRTLLITSDFPPVTGGVSHSLWNFYTALASPDTWVLTEPHQVNIHTDFPVIRKYFFLPLPWIWPRWLPLFWHAFRIVRTYGIRHVQAGQLLPTGTVAFLLKKILRCPYSVYVYGMDMVTARHSKRKMKLIKLILRSADRVIANSRYTQSLAIRFGAVPDKSVIMYPSISQHIPQPVSEQLEELIRIRHRLDGVQVIISVGNLVRRKGHDFVIHALAEIKKTSGTVPRYLIIGDGPNRVYLQTLRDKLGLTNEVEFAGKVPDNELAAYYHVADVVIMLSRELYDDSGRVIDVEGFGMVFLEANLYGKPVIAGKSGGVPEAVADGQSGLLVNPENTAEIAAAIHKLLDDSKLRLSMGQYGKRRAQTAFSLESQVSVLRKILS